MSGGTKFYGAKEKQGRRKVREDFTDQIFETGLGGKGVRKESNRQGNSKFKEQEIAQYAWS